MSKENLEKMTSKELVELCKQNNIAYSGNNGKLNKSQLVEKLLGVENLIVAVKETNPVVEEIQENIEQPWENKDKEKYIEEAEVGTLIAFYDKKKKPRTAALVNRSSTRRVIKVVTEFGWEFIVPYEDVLWVRKGTRWPKGVYNLLKGYNNAEK